MNNTADMFGKRITLLRKAHGYTQEQMSDYLKVGRSTYTRYESSSIQPDLEKLVLLAKKFNISTDFRLGLNDKKEYNLFEDVEEWIIEIINTDSKKKTTMKSIWKEIKKFND
jgi:transcriptional regulator with XRE-family HTH domain